MEADLDKLLKDTKQETTVDGKILSSGCQQDTIQTEQPVNTISVTTIENYLKDLMEIWQPRVDNSELLDGIDKVSQEETLWHISPERHEAIKKELAKLLAVGFIKEVYHPEWLANPVLILKKNNNE